MPHPIAVLVFPGFQLLDAAGPMAAFEAAGLYRVRVVARDAGVVCSSAGVGWVAAPLPRVSELGTLLVAGGTGVDSAMEDAVLLRFVRRAVAAGVRVASVCSGSLLLAAAGVLDGRTATTHWARTSQFQKQFPRVRLDADRIYVRQGAIWTSAGVSAGIDLAVAMIADDHGQDTARAVARELVVYYRRPGAQSQMSAPLDLQVGQDRIDRVIDHIRRHLGHRLDVEELAAKACLSPRHFAREFRAKTGVTPAKAVESLRVEAARAALQESRSSMPKVAADCGFGTIERMRRSFVRLLGVLPSSVAPTPGLANVRSPAARRRQVKSAAATPEPAGRVQHTGVDSRAAVRRMS
ncbi:MULTISPECIES: DJ-1/PfpI family protein [Ramlibacter]|uniref:DJ-1/PfpI family protein n=1 Tax=Ramlibacter aquaticus TaxID=2780094 RepID=A0ABR9SIZ5_9BURK|nr:MULTISPECIES: DJ-1/PfpI family protein [Ramlibacter]MBE7942338.1 DJ-1/PfpI family protein [Ramlibacter aquaticus]